MCSGPADLIPKYLQKWVLTPDGAAIKGNNAIVQPVRTGGGTPAMLRITPPTPHTTHDWLALSIWDGAGAVLMFEHDRDDGAMLMERLDHTRNLDVLPIEEAAVVAGTLRARLSRPAPDGLRTLESEAERWVGELTRTPALPPRIVAEAVGLCRDLGPGATGYLVNEDQHYHNILAGEREPWLVIDPMVLAGDREFGLATLIWGRLEESTTERILGALIATGELEPERARAWTFVGAVVKWANSQGRVAANCRTIATDLARMS